ncbi:DUF6370 family protein [Tenacibaculum caenipelagi]|uniref:Uncharacterized protein n=1 Tax=Tenacibaculum caenipelagi TaxID=1325435 RepID=A0A4R6TEX0_9FLAO|nr:DUF6370 family protein [Tenacibaculum caenipelagi]TDQ28835.1 hypothetical protein DFQ07_1216 [Tenacibaculum caenipelagi]
MKKFIVLIFFGILACANPKEKTQIVEASCGQCQFGLKNQNGCDLAIKVDGQAYFVDGAHIDDYGDSHDENTGFCNVVRKAEVSGKVEDGRFKSSSFKIVEK